MSQSSPGSRGQASRWPRYAGVLLGALLGAGCVDLTAPWEKGGHGGSDGGGTTEPSGTGGALDAGGIDLAGSGGTTADGARDVAVGGAGGGIDGGLGGAGGGGSGGVVALDAQTEAGLGGAGGSLDAPLGGSGGAGGSTARDGSPEARSDAAPDTTADRPSDGRADVGADLPADAPPDVPATLPPGLVAYYPCESATGTTLPDLSGNHNDGTLLTANAVDGGEASPGFSFAAGKIGQSLVLSNGGYVSLPPGIFDGATAITVAAWVKITTAHSWARIMDVGLNAHGTTNPNTGSKYFVLVPQNNASRLNFAITSNGHSNEQQLTSNAITPSSDWKHVAVTLDGSQGALYVGGSRVALGSNVTLTPATIGAIDYAYVGKSQWSADPLLEGQIDELRIYGRALTATEVQTLAQFTGP